MEEVMLLDVTHLCVRKAILKVWALYRTNLKSYSVIAEHRTFRRFFFAKGHYFSNIGDKVLVVMDQKSSLHVEIVCKRVLVHFDRIAFISLSKQRQKSMAKKEKTLTVTRCF